MADIAAVVIQTLQWVGAPVTRQFQYLCCFTRNITSLRNEAKQLEDTAHDLQLRVVGAENDSRVIYREVDTWLQDSKNIKGEMDGILNEVPNVESGCLKLGARFILSRRAKKTTDRVKGLINLGQSKLHADVIAQPAPAAAAAAQKEIPTTKSYEYESRKQIEEDIMATLRGGDVNMIGICGMGGLGKTTMAKKIRNRALEEHVFDEVVMVVVSRPIDQLKIQLEIGGSLGLKLEEECSEARVQTLHARLSGTKRILLVLDDVWEELVLEDLGIPSGYNPLILSYDVLEPKYQDVFLLCCVYPEDAHIPLEQLTYFCMGLRIATGNVEKARNRIRALTKVLKNRSLLLDSEKGDEYVRMHDVVRDVCIFIAKQKGYIGDNDLTPSLQRYKLHSGFELLQIRNSSDVEINFDGIIDLSVLSIERCSQLTSLPFTQRPNNLISSNSFQNLKILNLDDLPVLKQLWMSSQNDLGKDFLPQLEVLYIRKCGMMETVFLWKGEDGNENTSCHHITKRFPKLKELLLYQLPNLISLCQGIEGIEFPLLKTILIEECGKMKGMVWNEKISGGSSNNASIHALFCPQQVSFSELEELKIFGCQSILSLFTSSMAENLVNLKELWIDDCFEMVEVIKDDEEKGICGGQKRALLFPKLHTLTLWDLPKLVSFCESKGIESIQFPVLRSMDITRCGKMKGMVANGVTSNENNSGGDSTNAADIIHLFCQSKQVSFGCLKELDTGRNPFCSHTIHVSIFDILEQLTIYKYKGSMSLFSSSITGNLVNLTTLTIDYCDKMVKVIEEKEEEKEKVVSGAQRTTILFPKLQQLVLGYLTSLVRFCEWKCDVELPSLRRVVINSCRNMQSCTSGLLTTPNLKSVKIDREEFGDVKDLNGLVQQQYLRRAEEEEEKEEEEEEDNDDDDDDDDVKDLNGLVQQQYLRRAEEEEEEEEDNDDDDDDVKDLNGLVQQQYLRRAEETTDFATQKEAPAAAAK